MSERISVAQAAEVLRGAEDILLLTHQYPDGDTLGSGYALCRALLALGKRARVICADPIPEKYDYLALEMPDFEPRFICAVDVADPALLGALNETYGSRVDLTVDHHPSNVGYARQLLLKEEYGATAMLVFELIEALGVAPDKAMATALYTGIATDTGCFKYSNTTPLAHRMAASLMELGAPAETINRAMFDIKSRQRVELERLALRDMTFHFGGRCAIMTVTNEMVKKSGAGENDMEGLAPIPRQIEGVWVGILLRQKADGSFKVSLRTGNHANASDICARLGGGGHACAAGCTLDKPLNEAVELLLSTVAAAVPRIAL